MPQDLLGFTPAYTVVGVYRLIKDPNIGVKVWDKLRHGVQRGAIVGAVWFVATFGIQRTFCKLFLMNTPRVIGVSHDSFLGYPVNVATYATLLFMSSQVEGIIMLFVGKNLRIARDRAWDQTLASRGKGPEFWGPYVEEWQVPPAVGVETQAKWEKFVVSGIGRFVIKKVILLPLNFLPGLGLLVTAYLKAIGTARFLHKSYFQAKKMTPHEIAVFMAEHRVAYHTFGFAAALLEAIPFAGLLFSVSNRVGASMWAFDLEKRQQMFREGKLKQIPPPKPDFNQSSALRKGEKAEEVVSGVAAQSSTEKMAGEWTS